MPRSTLLITKYLFARYPPHISASPRASFVGSVCRFLAVSNRGPIENRFSRKYLSEISLCRTYLAFLLAVAGQSAVEVAGAGRIVAPVGGIGQGALEQAAPKKS